MNNKGFTLVEVLATIVILSLILMIAVPGVRTVANVVRKAQKENIIKDLEINGARYAFDSGETLFFVDDLIMYGYIDTEGSYVIDPTNDKSLNCMGLKAVKTGDYYKASLITDEEYIDGYYDNGICNRSILVNRNSDVIIDGNIDGHALSNATWTNISGNTITLNANIDCDPTLSSNRCVWDSSRGNIIGSSKFIFDTNGANLINTQFNFQKITYNSNGSVASRYTASFNVLIDKEVPFIDVENSYYSSDGEYVIIANDGIGSGVSGYCITNGSDCPSYSTNNKISVSRGNYRVWVKDLAGNVTYKDVNI